MRKIFLLILLICLSNSLLSFGQSKKHSKKHAQSESNLLDEAEYFFEGQDYLRALPVYLKLIAIDSAEPYYKEQAGICYLHKGDEKDKSIGLLESVYQQDPTAKDILFYLGRAYHLNNQFDKAIGYFNQYLNSKPKPSEDMQKLANRYIDYCNNAKKLVGNKVRVDIKNLGPPINTSASEYAPVVSADESVLMFTYRGARSTGGLENSKFKPDTITGEYYEDIFVSQKVGDTWLAPEGIGNHINTKGHDASIAISADGQTLFTYRSTPKDNGDIYVSHLNGTEWSTPKRLGPNINTKYWEGSCSLSADGQTLYFASERPGGFGKRDIYKSLLQADGTWGPATNLGPNINTPYNDDAPYIHPDGVTLFFSSEGHNSMGGSDIFYATYKDSAWSPAVNIGYPVNSTEDDRYYVLSADGSRGYFSSNRQGGYGQQDIYVVSPGFQGEKPILALVVGVVTADDKPTQATIKVTNAETGEDKGSFQSNSSTGKYLIALTPGNKYKVAIEVEGYEPHIEYVNVKSLDTYVQVAENVHLYSAAYKAQHPTTTSVADSSEPLQTKINQQLARYHAEDNLDVYEADMYQKILNEHADAKVDSVSYNVELGTYANAADFDSTKITSLGHITKRVDSKGHTTYSMGPFKTLLDAEVFKYQVFKQDSSLKNHTTVTVNNKGQRELIQQYYASEYTRIGYVPETDTKVIQPQNQAQSPAMVGLNDETKLNTNQLENDYGKSQIDGLSFKIELGAFKDPSDFKLGYLKKYGKIHQKTYPDGTVHYTMGPFATLAEADNFKKMLIEKEPQTKSALVMVFYFGKEQTVNQFFSDPCAGAEKVDFSEFVGKDLNDTAVYNKLIRIGGQTCSDGLSFVVQIGAYRHPQNFKHKNLNSLVPPPVDEKNYPDGITRFTMRTFKTLRQAELFRQQVIKLRTNDAWITAIYKGQRMLLQDLIAHNFYNASVN
ncbi:MAG TPA: tetratricopeptide repeat protein [Bacteroidia bacterium]|nr:tetratricopeptide repeat protein [Bacteroidia bacterium]